MTFWVDRKEKRLVTGVARRLIISRAIVIELSLSSGIVCISIPMMRRFSLVKATTLFVFFLSVINSTSIGLISSFNIDEGNVLISIFNIDEGNVATVDTGMLDASGRADNDTRTEERIQVNLEAMSGNATKESNKTLYISGHDRGSLANYLFPEFALLKRLKLDTVSTKNSLLLHGLFGPCPSNRKYPKAKFIEWISQQWRGKALAVNGEGAINTNRPSNIYQIGMVGDSNRSVHVFFLAIAMIGHYAPTQWEMLFNHTLKPQSTRKHFCTYSNSHCVLFREIAVDQISSSIKPIDQGGGCKGRNGTLLNKIAKNRQRQRGPRTAPWSGNPQLYREYRFCMVLENQRTRGYITEKILNAFLAGCIPIYYGTEEVFDVFNRKAFVYFNITNPDAALQQIRHLEENETEYLRVVRDEPILANGDVTIDLYFSLAENVGQGTLKRKIRAMLGLDD